MSRLPITTAWLWVSGLQCPGSLTWARCNGEHRALFLRAHLKRINHEEHEKHEAEPNGFHFVPFVFFVVQSLSCQRVARVAGCVAGAVVGAVLGTTSGFGGSGGRGFSFSSAGSIQL